MSPSRYRKKPVEIDAIRYLPHENCAEVAAFTGEPDPGCAGEDDSDTPWSIETREGTMHAMPGDWIIREPSPTEDRRFYPCKPDIFEAAYEPAGDFPS